MCAYELGIPMDKLKVKATNSMISANSATTGGSITSENCCEVYIDYMFLMNKFLRCRISYYYYVLGSPSLRI